MTRPTKLERPLVEAWLADHPGWAIEGDALVRTYATKDFTASLELANRVGAVANERDHHPDILVGWGKARFIWTTHDAGGITALDLDLAVVTDGLAAGASA